MIVGIPLEVETGETRVAATPETVKKMVKAGLTLRVQSGAGLQSSILDEEYKEAGAEIVADASKIFSESDIVLKVRCPILESELSLMKQGALLMSFLNPLGNPEFITQIAAQKICAISMEMVPRIARAQKLDALSSQSNVAGYKAVLMAANALGKMMPMMMTAAGTVTPAKVLILGAGVAGLQAIATARRLGALVEAFDVRPVVKDQVESLGAKFLEIDMGEQTEDKGGYAKELSEENHRKEVELLAKHSEMADIVITTALIPGRPSPKLITGEMVKKMKEGSVIIDLAAEGGGNCELTEKDKTVVKYGVTIVGETNLPGLMANQSSQLYARNVINLLLDYYKDGKLNLDLDDEIIKGSLLTRDGEVIHEMIQGRLAQGKGA